MCGMKVSIEDILFEVEQDRAYYENSSGGVTLSGGEVFCQAEFAEGIVDICLKKGISISIETNLNHPFDKIESILRKVSHLYIDIKLMDGEDHKKWTGSGNDLILQNVKKIDSMETSYTVRTPLIPEVTDTETNLTAIREFVNTLHKIKGWELMNFNPLGAGKYENLFIKNIFRDSRPLSKEKLNRISQKLKGNKVPMSIV
jgi:pyruvate formate lyase activating enzyme